jgi:hypothetical protein
VQVVEDNLLKLLVDLLLLAEDDITLALDGLGLELGVLEDVGEDVDGGGDVVVEGLGVVDGVLALSLDQYPSRTRVIRVAWLHVPKCRRSGGRPCFRSRAPAAAGCASGCPVGCISLPIPSPLHATAIGCAYLEGKVLEEVGSAVGPVRLGAASSIDPNTDSRRLGPRGVLGSDLRRRVNCSPESG